VGKTWRQEKCRKNRNEDTIIRRKKIRRVPGLVEFEEKQKDDHQVWTKAWRK
jgi:hypothetical protein